MKDFEFRREDGKITKIKAESLSEAFDRLVEEYDLVDDNMVISDDKVIYEASNLQHTYRAEETTKEFLNAN